jgi:hypothetical protein
LLRLLYVWQDLLIFPLTLPSPLAGQAYRGCVVIYVFVISRESEKSYFFPYYDTAPPGRGGKISERENLKLYVCNTPSRETEI